MIKRTISVPTLVLSSLVGLAACKQSTETDSVQQAARSPNNPVRTRPDVDGRRRRDRGNNGNNGGSGAPSYPGTFRTIDGSTNNLANPTWGTTEASFLRLTPVAYADGTGAPSGPDRPNPRAISNACSAQAGNIANSVGASDFVWQWGQFLDHDIDLSPEVTPEERFDIQVPSGDPAFDPSNTGEVVMPMHRSLYVLTDGVREQINGITAYIDASQVYGSDDGRARALRLGDGSGRLKTSAGDLLPFNTDQLPNAAPPGVPAGSLFVAGDFRANEQVGLTVMHTLFVREHNQLADAIRAGEPGLTGDEVYERARAIVAAQMQVITYREFLPVLLGPDALRPYRGYQEDVNPGISNVFATAAFRLGHSMLSSNLLRLGANNQSIARGPLSLADAFFGVQEVMQTGLDPFLRGLARQSAQAIDPMVIDEVRNFLFGAPGAGGFDLVSLNIQRGRDHGLPSYNEVRVAFGLSRVRSFRDVNPNPEVQANLRAVYQSVDDIDPWVGGVSEPPVQGAMVGEMIRAILVDQFERLRDGDRFWYERYLPPDLVQQVEAQTLAMIIRRNTDIGRELPDDVFRVQR